MKSRQFAAVALAALCGALAPSAAASDSESIYTRLSGMKDHAVLHVAAVEARTRPALQNDGPYTLFAPSDAAFKKLDDAEIKLLATDKKAVQKLMGGHLVEGSYTTKELGEYAGKELRTLSGRTLKVEKVGDGFRVGGAKVTDADLRCSNGVIHVVDTVLLPK